MSSSFRTDNLANWEARVPIHVASTDYGLQRFIADSSFISPIVEYDVPYMGSVEGLDVAHLQCHIGTDTVSLARLGARVTGIDFSEAAILAARDLSARCGTPAVFEQVDAYDAGTRFPEQFDLVYTTVGVLGWLDDITRWAQSVSRMLRPGGRLYVRDMHPFLWVYEEIDGEVIPTYPYVTPAAVPLSYDEEHTYTDGDTPLSATRCHSWNHPISSVINALVASNLTIEGMKEFDEIDWPAVPSCVKTPLGNYQLPAPLVGKVPAMFALWARAGER